MLLYNDSILLMNCYNLFFFIRVEISSMKAYSVFYLWDISCGDKETHKNKCI